MNRTQTKDYLTTQDLAELFARSPATVRYWIQHRGLARYGRRFGRDWVFTPEDVLRFLEEVMASWYADKQWTSEHRRLERVKARLLRLCEGEGKTRPAKRESERKAEFRSYHMGSLHGSLRRVELYRERPSRS
jgi:phage terminase Nu1 subunit (DNA packaging protein)